ncbi:MAG: HEAT repeat domain-containing protein [Planctomycetota bacterium]|nr:HEAT repeat domain-containing protein [Planctomycetota bacterium]
MTKHHASTHRLLGLAILVASLLSPQAQAQVDLPRGKDLPKVAGGSDKGKARPEGSHLVCTVCGEPNRTTKLDTLARDGFQQAQCGVCHRVMLHRQVNGGAGEGLDLPQSGKPEENGGVVPNENPAGAGTSEKATILSVPGSPAMARAAADILSQLDRIKRSDDPLAMQAVETLLSLGEPGLEAARLALASDWPVRTMTGLRVLLRGGRALDAELVVRRLRTRMPGRLGGKALEEFLAYDPVHATPSLLCELLDHPQSPVRTAAHRSLKGSPYPAPLSALSSTLRSRNGDARLKATDLLSSIAGSEATDLLLDLIDDPSPRVARRAVEALAQREDPVITDTLLALAFGERWVLRSGACALLAIVECEDTRLEPILGDAHTAALLRGLESKDEFVAGACATALAGIGFRSNSPDTSIWLEEAVPARLVRVVSGFTYFDDYESLSEPALRRLKQISGLSHGSDGPAWAAWWVADEQTFRACRAVIPVGEGSHRMLQVVIEDRAEGKGFTLIGPGLASGVKVARDGEAFFLSTEQARDLLDLLAAEGALGSERLPGVRGGQAELARSVELRLDGRSKFFVLGPGIAEPWFERIMLFAESLRTRSMWQRYPDPELHASRLALWRTEVAWWEMDRSDAERQARLGQLILARLAALSSTQRDDDLLALEDLYTAGGGDVAHFLNLTSMLSEELYFTGRAKRLASLAHRSARMPVGPGVEAPSMERLIGVLHDRFGADAMLAISEVVSSAGHGAAHSAAGDPRPLMRAVAAFVLAERMEDGDELRLLSLFDDDAIDVRVAAIQACGAKSLLAAREQVFLAASAGSPDLRVPALLAAGQIGGTGARDILITALTGEDSRLHQAAAEGIAALKDPKAIPIMLSILRHGERTGAFPTLREGLLELGEEAWDQLFSALRSPSPVLRREAALILARQTVPESAPALMRALAEDPADVSVARELCVLTCVDQRANADPAEAWFRWWDDVIHSDPHSWLRAAGEVRRLNAPPSEAFVGRGTRAAVVFLVEIMDAEVDWLVERARRELERMGGGSISAPPPLGAERDAWLLSLLQSFVADR